VLARLEDSGAPLLVHPGPRPRQVSSAAYASGEPSLCDPLWWSALTRYVAEMHAAWLAFVAVGRAEHPRLRVVFSMLAGLAPLHAERLLARGGPAPLAHDPLTFYESSSYGPDSRRRIAEAVGAEQLLYGSDRPVLDPHERELPSGLEWDAIAAATRRALGDRWAAPLAAVDTAGANAANVDDAAAGNGAIVDTAASRGSRSGALVR
jgi:predicted TIM-barrel fold metal-dependent hydrolase